MIARKILLAAAAGALMSTPAWALPSLAPAGSGAAHPPSGALVGPYGTTQNDAGSHDGASHHSGRGEDSNGRGDKGGSGTTGASGPTGPTGPTGSTGPTGPPHGHEHGHGHGHGRSHRCLPHGVAYVAGGTLVSQALSENADGTYSGEVVVEVKRTNRHAAGDRGKTVTYSLKNVHVTFGLPDMNKDGGVGLDDLAKGDRVHLIGRITVLAKKCSQGGFTPTTTIYRFVVNKPANGS